MPGISSTKRLSSLTLALALALVLLPSALAYGNSAELFGMGSRWAGMGDAAVATVDDFAAAFYNPAGLAWAKRGSVQAGFLGYGAFLTQKGGSGSIDNPTEAVLGVTFPFPFRKPLKDRLWIGVAFSTHPDILARFKAHLPTDAFYPYYDNRSQRTVLIPTLAFRVFDRKRWGRLSLGLGLNLLAGLQGTVVGQEGASRSVEARVKEELYTMMRVVAGASYQYKDFRFGLTFRQEFQVDVSTKSFNHVAGTDLNLDIVAGTLYDPHTIVAGAAWQPGQGKWTLSAELGYALWRLYKGPFVAVSSVLPLVGDLQGDLPDIDFKDAVSVRLGMERWFQLRKSMRLAVRAGLGFESSPVPVQHGRTNMLDGHKLLLSLGAGFDLGKVLKRRVWFDAHLRTVFVLPRTMDKELYYPSQQCPAPAPGSIDPDRYLVDERPCDRTDPSTLGFQVSNPGYPSIKSGGVVLSGGFTMGVEL